MPGLSLQGLALLKKMVELDDWSEIYAVSRSELPISSSKLMHCPLDLNDKEVCAEHYRFVQVHSIMVKTSENKQAYLRLNGTHKLKVAEIFELYSVLLCSNKM